MAVATPASQAKAEEGLSKPVLIGSLCTGYGGLEMAVLEVFGGRVAWHCENDPEASRVLVHNWPAVPNYGDLRTVDWASAERVDLVCAGFPCQDLSYAGRGAGITEGSRSGLWYAIADALGVLRPRYVFLENVGAIVGRRPGLDVVLGSLARLGFDAEWLCLRASDVGAAHERNRWYCLASDPVPRGRTRGPSESESAGRAGGGAPAAGSGARSLADSDSSGWQGGGPAQPERGSVTSGGPVDWGRYAAAIARAECAFGRAAPSPVEPGRRGRPRLSAAFDEWHMGLPAGHVTGTPGLTNAGRIRVIGNGAVPQQAAHALRTLAARY